MKRRRSLRAWSALVLAGSLLAQSVSADPLPNAWQITDNTTVPGLPTLTYRTNLPIALVNQATTSGFQLAVNARFLDTLSGTKSMAFGYRGNSGGWRVWCYLSGSVLVAELSVPSGPPIIRPLSGGTAQYHTFEIILGPTNPPFPASFRVDGSLVASNWNASGSVPGGPGEVSWGADNLLGGKGQMNFHSVSFSVTNNLVASYDAGTQGNPATAPDPTTLGWTFDAGMGTAVTNVSPDTALLPVAVTLAVDQVTNTSARLNGQANPSGSVTTAWFEWGTDTNYGNTTGAQNIGAGTNPVPASAVIGGLAGGQEYHYRLAASNSFGVVMGADQSFLQPGFLLTTIPGLPAVSFGSAAWGDYDNDGQLDFLLTGGGPGAFVSQLWRNTGSGFSNVTASVAPGLLGVFYSSAAWGDYDNDGRLDFLLTGSAGSTKVSQLWRNTGSGFSNVTVTVAPGLPGVLESSVAWGDFDNDGRLDFLLTGDGPTALVSQLWRNTGSGFSNVTASVAPGLPRVDVSSVAWGDYDNDGRLDFLLTGVTNQSTFALTSQLWRNTGGRFSNVTASVAPGLPAVANGSVAWGDYDHDGRLDFLLTGYAGSTNVFQLWRNTGSGFSNVTASVVPGLPGVSDSSVAWGDFDNDGRLDFLLAGETGGIVSTNVSQLWRNTGNGFSNVTASVAPGLPGVTYNSAAWGDYDNDGRLDFLLTGTTNGSSSGRHSQLWRNNLPLSNAPPAVPAGLSSTVSGTTVALNWTPPADDLTPAAGLSYNVRIGSAPGAADVLAPMALTNGLRLLPKLGNAQPTNAVYYLAHVAPGRTYYWSVQALDTSFAGSPFAAEQSFIISPRLVNPVRFSSGVIDCYFTNQTALNFDVLVSTNVALPVSSWINLGPALPLGGGYYRFTDAGAISQTQRFYLLRKQ